MITFDGGMHIKRYMAKIVPDIAQSIAIGVGTEPESTANQKLQFEVARMDILVTSIDFANNRLIYKGTLPETFNGTIYEAGIFSTTANSVAGEFGSKLITTFDSETEEWKDTLGADSVYASGTSRIGPDSLLQSPAANQSRTDILTQIELDLSGYSSSDKFIFAFNCGNNNTASVKFIFLTDSANYYTITLGAQTAGYKIVESALSTAVATGAPDWNDIREMRVTTTSTAAGAASVTFDGVRVEDVDTINPNYVLVSREVLSTPFIKEAGRTQDIEFSLDVVI